MELYNKLFALQGSLKVDKNGENPHFKSKYVTLDNLLSVLFPMLENQKLVLTNYIKDNALVTEIRNQEKPEEVITSAFPITQTDPQKIGSCITYAKRYNLGSLFNIITEWDDDGEGISGDNHKVADKNGLTIDDYIDSIRMEDDPEHIKTLYLQAYNGLKLTDGQLDWLKGEARKRTDILTNPTKSNRLPSEIK